MRTRPSRLLRTELYRTRRRSTHTMDKDIKWTTWFDQPGRGFSLYESIPESVNRPRDPKWEPCIGKMFTEPGEPGYRGPKLPCSHSSAPTVAGDVIHVATANAQPTSSSHRTPSDSRAPIQLKQKASGEQTMPAPATPLILQPINNPSIQLTV